jgi:hypothetical protein
MDIVTSLPHHKSVFHRLFWKNGAPITARLMNSDSGFAFRPSPTDKTVSRFVRPRALVPTGQLINEISLIGVSLN